MVALSERKMEIVRTLVTGAPDRIVDGLHQALADASGDTPLATVRRLVENEVRDRRLRNIVLQPIAPMCVGDGRDTHGLTFPSFVLGLLWKGLKAVAPQEIEKAAVALYDFRPGESSPAPFDALVKIACDAVRARDPKEFRLASDLCDQARDGGAGILISCLEIAPVVRRSTVRLPEWIAHFGEETTAAARLAYRDACAVSDDGGPRYFEMIAAQMPHPWMVLRVISAVMEKPNERYLAESELGAFAERVMADIDEALRAISQLDIDAGPDASKSAATMVELVTLQVAELESTIELSREEGWGRRLHKQKNSLATVVEGRIRDAEKYVITSLPTQPPKLRRMRRSIPRLSIAPDKKIVSRAMTLLHFAREIRSSANYGGFASARGKMLEKVGDHLDHYVEEVLDLIKTGDAESESVAREFLNVVAEYSRLVRDDKAADLVRRRAAAAHFPETPAARVG
ncbi:hypothetical protein [Phenylobacterium sp.]|jgi:hypothetical protein|uniref:hypothetical protein n=1 Tax=Phenylobacterium sp. TaxID=1871053 RepID=UPI002F928A93